MLDVSVIIVNYKTPELLAECIRSIYRETKEVSYEIIVIDNNSQDYSKEYITEQFPYIRWIQNEINEGFGRANNKGILASNAKYILLLNSDTVIIDQAIDKTLKRFIREEKNTGLAGCTLLNADGSKQKSAFYYNASLIEVLNYNLIFNYFYEIILKIKRKHIRALHGAFLFFEKQRIESVGYFDSDFFLYAEEFEWCNRITNAGFKLKIFDDISIIHKEEGSSSSKIWNTKQRYVSNALLFKKSRGNLILLVYYWILVINFLTNGLLLLKMSKSYQIEFLKSYRFHLQLFPYYIAILTGSFTKPLKFKG